MVDIVKFGFYLMFMENITQINKYYHNLYSNNKRKYKYYEMAL